ncbi:MAG: IS1380 family transposase [Candidatus Electrothrix scaldis]|nr:MAG: IS1380 family transposase [Candidatus Electrothrix sp. GW3-3]WPD22713.1 MAG: IS1380 family transposase [Candidatus Electrothrix sp. GW3-3]WPD22898.1 MAG: IS1380 family transposase [Candidatus Electrothrix sp. GW3-3]WPD23155.1 MAG: IS1380 family transposase [Candidatus Electrothrix sp. GW3-3]
MKSKQNKRSARVSPKKIQINKGAKGVTAQAGLIPAVKFLQKHNVGQLIQETLEHQRGATATYDAVDIIFLPLIAIIGGARSISNIATVWADSVLCRIAGWRLIPDETTFGRLFRTFSYRHINNLEVLNHRLRARMWRKGLRSGKSKVGAAHCLVVDVDSTEKTVYGSQQGAAKGFNPHKRGAKSYHPLLAFCAESKEILQGWLRCGNAYTSNGIVEFTKQLLAHLPNGTRILFRGDSGFFVGALLDLLDQYGHSYLIKVKLKGLVTLLSKQSWEPVPGQAGWEQCIFFHKCTTWSSTRLFVAVRREKPADPAKPATLFEMKEFDYFCYVVSEIADPWQVHKRYGQRATCETWIEEAKNQTALVHIKTEDFWANSVLFQAAILAYNTIRWMALLSGNAVLRRWEPGTIRTFLVRVAGKYTTGGRQQKLFVPERMLYSTQWDDWVAVGLY